MELVWTHASGSEQARLSLPDHAFLSQLQQAFGDRVGRFTRIGQRFSYPLSLVTAEEPVRPGLAVLGNAAHALHPVAGQGFNLALRSVMDLVEALSVLSSSTPWEIETLRRLSAAAPKTAPM